MADVVEILREELAGLERELAADPRYLKAQRIRELLALYEPASVVVLSPAPISKSVVRVPPPAKQPSKARLMEQAIRDYLEPRGIAHRKGILEALTNAGFMEGMKNPMANLAAFMSDRKEIFTGHGGGMWSLASSVTSGTETPSSGELLGAPKGNGALPLYL
jgi:hypothetical protein